MVFRQTVRSTLDYLFNQIQKYVVENGFSSVLSMQDRELGKTYMGIVIPEYVEFTCGQRMNNMLLL